MINVPLSFVGKAKQAPLLIVGKRILDRFAIFNWKGCLEASYITRMSTSVLSYSVNHQCPYNIDSPQKELAETLVFL